MATQKKIETVQEMTDNIKKAKSIVFVDYVGLKHKQLEDLRKKLRVVGAEFMVTKNKLLERAFGTKADSVKPLLKNATGTLFNFDDEVTGIKELLAFFKKAAVGKAKAGILGETLLTEADVTRLSKIPPKQQLLGQLAGQLMAPIQGLHHALSWNMNKLVWALTSIKDQKSKK
ncbi:MAG: 50S ribosomal protein L10 [Microgenomates group bacterium GW2011_GWB1_40_9]|nr:MAG: 50S ribosomal protein L10 [Microgenomates group bacterium GW2011_GWC1_39_12]KKR78968.1 MAG: 50S ribosomal protein L10 [Microgenomates group bacterium GW2011_GWB1_40_9]